jgi:hypothetical protein
MRSRRLHPIVGVPLESLAKDESSRHFSLRAGTRLVTQYALRGERIGY